MDSKEAKAAVDLEAMVAENSGVVLDSKAKVCRQSGLWQPQLIMPHRLRMEFPWWKQHASWEVCNLIAQGLQADRPLPVTLSCHPCVRSQEDTQLALEVLKEYVEVGAVTVIHESMARHLIPWFLIKKLKGEKTKLRLISDCRELNQFFKYQPFRLDNWSNIFPVLRQGMWAAKLDLRHAYFHLRLRRELKPFVCLKLGNQTFQFQSACFRLAPLPHHWQQLMKTFLKRWRQLGILVWIYLDDILLVGNSASAVRSHVRHVLTDMDDAGLIVNKEKSILDPVQELDHLGFHLNLKEGLLQVPSSKLKMVRRELGKLCTHESISARKMAAILGSTRAFLMAMPFLRAFADQTVQFVAHHSLQSWD